MNRTDPALLVWQSEPGKAFVLDPADSPLRLGRDTRCDLVVPDPEVSALQARIEVEGPFWVWQDRSTNGTEFASVGRSVELVRGETRRLRDDDRLYLGSTVLRFSEASLGTEVRAPTPEARPVVCVTRTQLKVLTRLAGPSTGAAGLAPASNQEICDALSISGNTLRKHLRDLYVLFDIPKNSGTSHQRRTRLAAESRRARIC